jgi:aryl-alcohol dehydrogenase-like predicted oxidoreductase
VRYRSIPQTTLRLSEIGFGCAGNSGLMVRGSRDEQTRTIARALELGITYFDTAPDYGDGVAEENLGAVLRELRQRPVITSKVEVRQDDLPDIAGHVVRSCEASLRRLGLDHLDILQIHNGPVASGSPEGSGYRTLALQDYLRAGGALEGIVRLKRAGKIDHAGFCCRGDDINEVRALFATREFRLINVPYTLINPSAGLSSPPAGEPDYGGVIDEAGLQGLGCAIFSPLAGGILTDAHLDGATGHPLARPRDRSSADARRRQDRAECVRFLARETGLTFAQAAYRFILMHEHVTTVIGGFSSQQQMEELVPVSGMGPFGAEHMARLHAVWRAD